MYNFRTIVMSGTGKPDHSHDLISEIERKWPKTDNALLVALAISAVNEAEQMSALLPRNAEGKNMII